MLQPQQTGLAQRCVTPGGRPLTTEVLARLLQQWEETQTGSLEDPSKPGGEDNGRLDLAALQQDRRQQQDLNMDPHLAALPRLLEALSPLQRQVIEGLYLHAAGSVTNRAAEGAEADSAAAEGH